MSAAAVAWAFRVIEKRNDGLTPAMKLVLLRLADRADPNGVCWPGHERTARDLGLSESTVHAAIAGLGRAGILRIIRRRDQAGRDKPNLYEIPITVPADSWVPNLGTRSPKRAAAVPKSAPESQNKSNLKEKQQHVALEPATGRGVSRRAGSPAAATALSESKASHRPGSPFEFVDGVKVYRATDDLERLERCRALVSPEDFARIVARLPEPRFVSQVEEALRRHLAEMAVLEADRKKRTEAERAAIAETARHNSPDAIAARDAALKSLAHLLGVRRPAGGDE